MSCSQHPASDAAPPPPLRGAPIPTGSRVGSHPSTPGREVLPSDRAASPLCPPKRSAPTREVGSRTGLSSTAGPVSTVPGGPVGPRGEWTLEHQHVVATSAHHHTQEPGRSGREAHSAQVTREETAAQLNPGPRATQQPQDTLSHYPAQPSSYLPCMSRPWAQRPAP